MSPILVLLACLDTYPVAPGGDDGRAPERAWRSVAKVNASAFRPGDRILFPLGGEGRESLRASSHGAPGALEPR